jgi:hypothetical protein
MLGFIHYQFLINSLQSLFSSVEALPFPKKLVFRVGKKALAFGSSFAIFGRAMARANCKCAYKLGWLDLTRPEFSLHFLVLNPVSNLHFIFNPKHGLLFLNLSLWSEA